MPETALEIQSGAELLTFQPNEIELYGQKYLILTGHEGTGRCWWCGAELTGNKLKRWCWGHGKEYYRHFQWGPARNWCCERQHGICANCGWHADLYPPDSWHYDWYPEHYDIYALEVHHIVPLEGRPRFLSAFNLPWNLVGLCHACHQKLHAAMRPPARSSPDPWVWAEAVGQSVMPLDVDSRQQA
jgi:hypothetical protein